MVVQPPRRWKVVGALSGRLVAQQVSVVTANLLEEAWKVRRFAIARRMPCENVLLPRKRRSPGIHLHSFLS